jgi:NADH dehydrogenase
VTLLDRQNHHLFQPLLYQVATAALSPADIAEPLRGIVRKQENCEVLLAEVKSIDTAAKTVITDGEPVSYDYLVVAAGARHHYFGHDDWEKVAPGLKSLDDALEIRRKMLLSFELAEKTEDDAERQAAMTLSSLEEARRALKWLGPSPRSPGRRWCATSAISIASTRVSSSWRIPIAYSASSTPS